MRLSQVVLVLLAGGCARTPVPCLDTDITGALAAHLNHVDAVMGLTVGHAGPQEAVALLEAPGYEGQVAYASLFMVCSEPTLYDESCDGIVCTQIECTGEGAGWIMHVASDGPVTSGAFALDAGAHAAIEHPGAAGGQVVSGDVVLATIDGTDLSVVPTGDCP